GQPVHDHLVPDAAQGADRVAAEGVRVLIDLRGELVQERLDLVLRRVELVCGPAHGLGVDVETGHGHRPPWRRARRPPTVASISLNCRIEASWIRATRSFISTGSGTGSGAAVGAERWSSASFTASVR